MKEKLLLFLFGLILATFIFIFTVTVRGEHLAFLERSVVAVTANKQEASLPTPQPIPCSITARILESDPNFDHTSLVVGDHDIQYSEERFLRDEYGNIRFDKNGKARTENVTRKDPEREIALKLLDLTNCETKVIKIKKVGQDLIAPLGYSIEVVERPSGIRWNAHNTYYKVKNPENMVVIRNVWPEIKYEKGTVITIVKGKKKKATVKIPVLDKNKPYVPYSEEIKNLETIQKGITNLKANISEAKDRLRANGVKSKAFPDRLIADVLPDEFYWRRPIIEQSDLGEFILDSDGTADRFFVILGTNGANAWSSCNYANACGWLQFTPGTYKNVVSKYPAANLIKEFQAGSFDQINVAMAAILLDDLNLADLVGLYGNKIYNDPKIEEYLAAAYNGAPRWVHKSLNATIGKSVSDWSKHLKSETKGFMVKLRYLRDNKIPS